MLTKKLFILIFSSVLFTQTITILAMRNNRNTITHGTITQRIEKEMQRAVNNKQGLSPQQIQSILKRLEAAQKPIVLTIDVKNEANQRVTTRYIELSEQLGSLNLNEPFGEIDRLMVQTDSIFYIAQKTATGWYLELPDTVIDIKTPQFAKQSEIILNT